MKKRLAHRQSTIRFIGLTLLILAAVCILPALLLGFIALPKLGTGLAMAAMFPVGMALRDKADNNPGGGLTAEDFQTRVLAGVDALQKTIGAQATDIEALKKQANETATNLVTLQKLQASTKATRSARPGQVSDECARYLGALAVAAGLRQGKILEQRDWAEGLVKDVLGEQTRTALSSSDIPLPVDYGREVVELVSQYGAARRWGTVYPLGASAVNLPRLKTQPAFGLVTAGSAVGQVSPQTEWVTFTPQKFGGMILVPSEIDEDTMFGLGQFIGRYAAREIARLEDHNFFAGTGANSGINGTVKGLCVSTIDNSRVVVTGTLGAYSESTLAHWRSLRSEVDAAVMLTGAYYCHPSFEQHLSTFNSAGDMPFQRANGRYTLDGYEVRFVDVMPAYSSSDAVSTVFALFGDLSYQYLGVRRGVDIATSVEAGFTLDSIYIRALERFTIGLMATGAIAGLETYSS